MPRRNEIYARVTTPAQAVIFDSNRAREDRQQHHRSDNEAALHETGHAMSRGYRVSRVARRMHFGNNATSGESYKRRRGLAGHSYPPIE